MSSNSAADAEESVPPVASTMVEALVDGEQVPPCGAPSPLLPVVEQDAASVLPIDAEPVRRSPSPPTFTPGSIFAPPTEWTYEEVLARSGSYARPPPATNPRMVSITNDLLDAIDRTERLAYEQEAADRSIVVFTNAGPQYQDHVKRLRAKVQELNPLVIEASDRMMALRHQYEDMLKPPSPRRPVSAVNPKAGRNTSSAKAAAPKLAMPKKSEASKPALATTKAPPVKAGKPSVAKGPSLPGKAAKPAVKTPAASGPVRGPSGGATPSVFTIPSEYAELFVDAQPPCRAGASFLDRAMHLAHAPFVVQFEPAEACIKVYERCQKLGLLLTASSRGFRVSTSHHPVAHIARNAARRFALGSVARLINDWVAARPTMARIRVVLAWGSDKERIIYDQLTGFFDDAFGVAARGSASRQLVISVAGACHQPKDIWKRTCMTEVEPGADIYVLCDVYGYGPHRTLEDFHRYVAEGSHTVYVSAVLQRYEGAFGENYDGTWFAEPGPETRIYPHPDAAQFGATVASHRAQNEYTVSNCSASHLWSAEGTDGSAKRGYGNGFYHVLLGSNVTATSGVPYRPAVALYHAERLSWVSGYPVVQDFIRDQCPVLLPPPVSAWIDRQHVGQLVAACRSNSFGAWTLSAVSKASEAILVGNGWNDFRTRYPAEAERYNSVLCAEAVKTIAASQLSFAEGMHASAGTQAVAASELSRAFGRTAARTTKVPWFLVGVLTAFLAVSAGYSFLGFGLLAWAMLVNSWQNNAPPRFAAPMMSRNAYFGATLLLLVGLSIVTMVNPMFVPEFTEGQFFQCAYDWLFDWWYPIPSLETEIVVEPQTFFVPGMAQLAEALSPVLQHDWMQTLHTAGDGMATVAAKALSLSEPSALCSWFPDTCLYLAECPYIRRALEFVGIYVAHTQVVAAQVYDELPSVVSQVRGMLDFWAEQPVLTPDIKFQFIVCRIACWPRLASVLLSWLYANAVYMTCLTIGATLMLTDFPYRGYIALGVIPALCEEVMPEYYGVRTVMHATTAFVEAFVTRQSPWQFALFGHTLLAILPWYLAMPLHGLWNARQYSIHADAYDVEFRKLILTPVFDLTAYVWAYVQGAPFLNIFTAAILLNPIQFAHDPLVDIMAPLELVDVWRVYITEATNVSPVYHCFATNVVLNRPSHSAACYSSILTRRLLRDTGVNDREVEEAWKELRDTDWFRALLKSIRAASRQSAVIRYYHAKDYSGYVVGTYIAPTSDEAYFYWLDHILEGTSIQRQRMLATIERFRSRGAVPLDFARKIAVFVKADEVLISTRFSDFSPRPIHSVSPAVAYAAGPEVYAFTHNTKLFMWFHEIRPMRTVTYLAGCTVDDLNSWWKNALLRPGWHIAVAGDDTIAVTVFGDTFMAIESDLSQCDHTVRAGALVTQYACMRAGGVSDQVLNLLGISAGATLQARKKSCEFRMRRNAERNTGGVDTSVGNSFVTALMYANAVTMTAANLEMSARELGLLLKVRTYSCALQDLPSAPKPSFLKGLWLFRADASHWTDYTWSRLPSAVLKLGKTTSDPRVTYRASGERALPYFDAAWRHVCAVCTGIAGFSWGPGIRQLVDRHAYLFVHENRDVRVWWERILPPSYCHPVDDNSAIQSWAAWYSVSPGEVEDWCRFVATWSVGMFYSHPFHNVMAVTDYK